MKHFGIIGYPLKSSFSRNLFNEKFERENIAARYDLCPIENIEQFRALIAQTPFAGMNVTIPYKQAVMPYLTALDETAREIGAVNVIRFEHAADGSQRTTGYNTDAIGFERSLLPLLGTRREALVLGTGGASKAVAYILRKNGIAFRFVSRTPQPGQLAYADLSRGVIAAAPLIINTTPLGMYPPDSCPDIPYEHLDSRHLLYDLVYNPAKTLFLERGEQQGAAIKNGLEMLHGQAAAAWEIWN